MLPCEIFGVSAGVGGSVGLSLAVLLVTPAVPVGLGVETAPCFGIPADAAINIPSYPALAIAPAQRKRLKTRWK